MDRVGAVAKIDSDSVGGTHRFRLTRFDAPRFDAPRFDAPRFDVSRFDVWRFASQTPSRASENSTATIVPAARAGPNGKL